MTTKTEVEKWPRRFPSYPSWTVWEDKERKGAFRYQIRASGGLLAVEGWFAKGDAERICKAVNSHEALLGVKTVAKAFMEYAQARGIGPNYPEFVRLGLALEEAIAQAEERP